MKKSLLFFFGSLLLMTGLVSAQDTQVDKRILNNLYWMNMAERGLAKLNPDIPPPPSSYLGRSITPPSVLGGDSPDVLTSDDPNITQSENSGFVNPLDDDKVINSNNSTNWPVTLLYGTSDYQTSDGGLTWAGTVSLTGAGNNSGDPSAAIDLNGRYYVNFINPSFGISTAYSTNEGASWTNSVVHSSGNDDKNHVWPDNSSGSPYEGNIYTDWTDFNVRGGAILISRSTNGGINWSSSIDVSLAAGGLWGQGANVQTGPNGEVYAIWAIYDNPYPSDETAIGMAKSTDGGVTYGTSTRIINGIRGVRTQGTDNGGPIPHRVNSFPSGAVDISGGPHAGWVYAVWTNHGVPGVNTGNDLDVYVIRSTNGGSTWSTPIRVNQDPIGAGKRHYEAWMSCDPITGSLSVIWYDNRNTSGNAVETWVGTSIDGGNTWENFRVSDVSFTPAPIPGLAGGYMGDYLNICSRGGKVYPFWADNRNGITLTYTSPFLLATNIGWVDGTVTSGGNPLEGVDIDFTETGFIQVPGTSDAAGHYLAGAEVDTGVGSQNYTLRAQKFGYTTYTAPLTLVLNDTITHNFSMSTAPGGTLMVHAHTSDGSGVGAAVDVFLGGTVVLSGNTDPGTGDFTTPLPSGTYDVTVNPPDPYATVLFTGVVITANQTTNLDALMEPYVLFEDRIDSLSLSIEGGAKDSIQFYVRNNGIQSGDFSAQVVLFPRPPLEGGTAPITIPLTVYPSKVQRTTHVADYPRGNFAASAGLAPRQALLGSKKKDGVTPSLRGPVGTAYAISANLGTGAEELYSFNLGTPDMFRYIADMGSPEFFAGDFGADGLLYVLDYNTNQLATVDTSTGVVTFIGSSFPNGAETWTGLTWDNSTGTWYASSTDITRSTLYTVDPSTGTTTIVGELTGSAGNIDVSADNTGQLYGYDIVTDMFYSVDKGTGATTTLGPIGFDASFAQGMDFDPATNICYMAAFNVGTFQGELRTVDLSTGNTTLVGTFPNQEVTVASVAGSYGGVWLTLVPKSGTIAPGDSVLMTARFDATDPKIYENPGDYFGRVDIKSTNSPAPDTLSIPAKMFVVPPPGARLTLLPTSLDFGDVQVYDNKTLSVRIKNIGASQLDVTDITTTDPLYTVQPPTSFSVASLDTHRVFVTFTAPFPAGTYNAMMNFTSNDPLAPSLPMTAEAFGVPHFVDRIDSLQLDIEGGLTDSLQFFMSNDGTEDGTFHARAILTPQNLAAGKFSKTFEIPVSLTSANGEVKLAKSRNGDEVTVASKKKAAIGTTNRSNSLGDYPRGKFGASAGPAPRSAFKVGNTRKKGGSPLLRGPSTTAYAISANLSSGEEELYSFNVATPDMFRYIADMGSAEYFAGDFGPDGFLYGLNYFTNQLATIDTSTGVATIIGSSIPNGAETWTGLTYDNSTATWYASSGDGVRSTLYTVDPTTGQTTIVGEMTGSPLNIDISADNTGQIYGYDISTDLFYSVDKGTGATTNIGPIGFDASFAQGMDFDPATNTCYMAAFNVGSFQGELRTVDIFTGSTTLIGTFPNEEVTVVGIAGVFGTPWLSISPTSGTVAIGDSVVLTTHFDATDPEIYENPGNYFGEIRVTATDPFADTLSIPVRMNVARPLGARLIANPHSIDYGDVEIGGSSVGSVLVTNIGLTTLDVTNITTGNSNFTITAPTTFSLVTGDTHRVYVTFTAPEPAGDYLGALTFTSNDPLAATVPLIATSVTAAHIAVNPTSFEFTLTSTDTSRSTMTIYNPGTGQLSFQIDEGLASLSATSISAAIERSQKQQPHVDVPQKGKDGTGPGQPPVTGMGGPDAYGYAWIDSDEPGGPTFEWTDITGLGTQILSQDDENVGPFPLGFNFNFYGTTYSSVRVCSNGFLSFTSSVATYTNEPIPSVFEPNNAIYPFWDDLFLPSGGTVHYYADAANNRFIVQYTNVPHISGDGPYTFQVIIQSNGNILCQYLSMGTMLNSSTTGIENSDGTIALQVTYNSTYVHNNLALLFTKDLVPWMSAEPTTGTIDPGDSMAVEIRVHPAGLASGNYQGNFILSGNSQDVITVPVTMDLLTGVPEAGLIPTVFGLSQNYPNPFNPTTRIKYTLPEQSTVSLKIYNLLGQEMVSIASGVQEAGFYELTWDGRNSRGTNVGSGVYFYRFEATGSSGKKFTDLKKMLFLK